MKRSQAVTWDLGVLGLTECSYVTWLNGQDGGSIPVQQIGSFKPPSQLCSDTQWVHLSFLPRPSHIYPKPIFPFLSNNINCLKSPLYLCGTYFTCIWYVQLHYKWSQQPSVFQLYRCENRSWSHKSAAELTGAWTSRATSNSTWGLGLDFLNNFMLKTITANKRKQNNDFVSCVSTFWSCFR